MNVQAELVQNGWTSNSLSLHTLSSFPADALWCSLYLARSRKTDEESEIWNIGLVQGLCKRVNQCLKMRINGLVCVVSHSLLPVPSVWAEQKAKTYGRKGKMDVCEYCNELCSVFIGGKRLTVCRLAEDEAGRSTETKTIGFTRTHPFTVSFCFSFSARFSEQFRMSSGMTSA